MGAPVAAEVGVVLLKLVVLLAAARVAAEVAERLGQPAVLGELLAGVLLGPTLLGFVDFSQGGGPLDALRVLAELGVLFLLFEVGLETRLGDMLRVGASSSLVALIGIVGSFGAGFGASWALARAGVWSDSLLLHFFVGATLTATSVGITARVLSDLGRLATAEARIILGAAVLDDVGGLLLLAAFGALAAGGVSGWALAGKAALALGFLALVLLLGVRAAPPLFDRLARMRSRGGVLVAAVVLALLAAWLAEQVGLAGIVGAFAAGVGLAATRQREAIGAALRHVSDLFVPLFFVYVGLQLDLRGLGSGAASLAAIVAILTLAALAGKLASGLGVLERGGDRMLVGVGMVPRGEVGLIFAVVGLTTLVAGAPLLDAREYGALLLAIALTTLLAPLWLKAIVRRRARGGSVPLEDRAQA